MHSYQQFSKWQYSEPGMHCFQWFSTVFEAAVFRSWNTFLTMVFYCILTRIVCKYVFCTVYTVKCTAENTPIYSFIASVVGRLKLVFVLLQRELK